MFANYNASFTAEEIQYKNIALINRLEIDLVQIIVSNDFAVKSVRCPLSTLDKGYADSS